MRLLAVRSFFLRLPNPSQEHSLAGAGTVALCLGSVISLVGLLAFG